MSAFSVAKLPDEEFNVAVTYINKDPNITYTVSAIESVIVIDRKTGEDVSANIIDLDLSDFDSNIAYPWIKAGGEVGDKYDITVLCSMTTGQKFAKSLELSIVEKV